MTVIDEALRVDGLEVASADLLVGASFNGDGFDPVKGVLKRENRMIALGECEDQLVRKQWICGGCADV